MTLLGNLALELRMLAGKCRSVLRKEPELPTRLNELVEASLWASNGHDDKRIPLTVTKMWDPSSYGINLQDPVVMRDAVRHSSEFWFDEGCAQDIDLDAHVLIGDFGLGSDSPIIIDTSKPHFPVLYLHWGAWQGEGSRSPTSWQTLSDDFETFVATIFPDGPDRPT